MTSLEQRFQPGEPGLVVNGPRRCGCPREPAPGPLVGEPESREGQEPTDAEQRRRGHADKRVGRDGSEQGGGRHDEYTDRDQRDPPDEQPTGGPQFRQYPEGRHEHRGQQRRTRQLRPSGRQPESLGHPQHDAEQHHLHAREHERSREPPSWRHAVHVGRAAPHFTDALLSTLPEL